MNSAPARWGLIYPVHFLRGEKTLSHRKEIERLDYLSAPELRSYQGHKLQELLRWCSKEDPYYRKVLERITDNQGFARPFEILKRMPFLTKEIVRQEEATRRHKSLHRLDHRSTSGSTGSPFSFYKDRLSTSYMEAVQNHVYSWHDVEIGEPQGRFWGIPSGRAGKLARVKDFLKNRIRFSAFDLCDEAKTSFYRQLLRFRPTYLYGYPSLMLDFARFARQKGYAWDDVPLRVAIGTGEYMYSREKEELEQLLGVPFVNEYGCTEIGVIGFSCPDDRMHMMAANIVMEVIDEEDRPVQLGTEGELVVTELNSRYFPFIRYRLGDRGCLTEERCPCGRTLPVLRICSGRRDDYILTPEGGKIYDAILAYNLKEGILQFKAVQERVDHLRIFVRAGEDFTDSLERDLVARLKKAISSSMEISIVRVDQIPRESSGKLRYFHSTISGDDR